MALTLKGPAEGGNGGKITVAQIQILVQHHNAALAPTVQPAVFRQPFQIFHAGNVDGFFERLFPLRQRRNRNHRKKQAERKKDREELFHCLSHCCISSPSWDLFSPDRSGSSAVGDASGR